MKEEMKNNAREMEICIEQL